MIVSPQIRPKARYQEAVVIPFPGSRNEDITWRSMGVSNKLNRELPAATHDRHIALSFALYRSNPLAHRLIEMQVNFVLGNGITVSSPNGETLALISKWWSDPYNGWPRKIHQRLRDLYCYGEWLHRPLVAPGGFTFIRDIQPDRIQRLTADQMNHSETEKVIFKSENYENPTWAYVIRKRLDEQTATVGPYTGDVFHFGINRTTDTLRGVGELFTVIDHLDILDEMMFSRAEKIQNMSHVWWDLTLEGMDESQIRNYLAQETNVPPRPGSVYAHNLNAKLAAMTADLKADDHAADVRLFKSHIISSSGWPGTWFDDPGSAGRAVGAEMAEPALKNIINLQDFVNQILRGEIDYMLEASGLDASEYAISFSRPSTKDYQRLGPALRSLGQFLNFVTTTVPILTQQEAREMVVSQIHQLGLSDVPLSMELPVGIPRIITPADAADAAEQAAQDKAKSDLALAKATPAPNTPTGRAQGDAKIAERAQQMFGPNNTSILW